MTHLPELLLRDAAWLRTLTRKLAGDAELAADLQQDVALAALAQPECASLGRSWLAAVARNLALMLRRSSVRERARLQRLPGREPTLSPAELVASAELQQQAVAAVLALPAVYRDTVLLRFMHGLSLAATASAMGVPEETVRTRQKRALAMLRARLLPARERRGIAAMVGSLVAWGIAMKGKQVAVVGAVMLVALLLTVPFWPGEIARPPASPTGAPMLAKVDAGRSTDATAAAGIAALPQRIEIAVPAADVGPTTASLTVHVTWKDDGAPAVSVPVQCRRWTEAGTFAATDAGGEVEFAGLEAGEYRIGTHDWHIEALTIAAGEHATLERVLPRGRSVTGVVLDPDGAPVADAAILVSAGGTAPQWSFPVGHSDARGCFGIRGLRDAAMIGASDRRHGTSEFRLLMDQQGVANAEEIVLRLPLACVSLQGRVVDAAGKPIGGAWVEVGSLSGGMRQDDRGRLWLAPPGHYTTSAADGSFATGARPAGECPVLVYHQGFAPYRDRVQLAAGAAPLLVTLHAGGVLTGTVRDAAGNVVVGAEVEETSSEFPRRGSQDIGNDAAFHLDDLPPGELTFRVSAPSFPRQERTFTFTGSEAQHWDVVLQVERAIRGRLVDHNGQPLADWWVAPRGANRRARTDADGRFVIAECDDDNELVVRDAPGFVPERTRFLDARPTPEEQTFVVPADSAPSAHLRGQCVDTDGTPLADAMLHLTQANRPILFAGDGCGADGRFAVGPLPMGSYLLMPQHPQFVFRPVAAGLQSAETRELGILRGARPARLVLRLIGDRAALAEAKVELVGPALGCRSDGDGSERTFVRVFPGRYRIVVHRGELELDCGEVDLAPGADLARDLTVQ